MTPAAMTPGERAARDEAARLTLMTARLTREVEALRAVHRRDLDTIAEYVAEVERLRVVVERLSAAGHEGAPGDR